MNAAAGIVFVTPDDEVLLLERSGLGDHPGEWCIPGGAVEDGETPLEAAKREAAEEVGDGFLAVLKRGPVEWTRTVKDGLEFTAYLVKLTAPFIPELNPEHTQFAWVPLAELLENQTAAAANSAPPVAAEPAAPPPAEPAPGEIMVR